MSGGPAVGSDLSAVQVGKQSDSGPGPEVDFPGESSHSEVDPVLVEGGQLVP